MNNTLSPMLLYCRKILHFASGSHQPGVDYFRMPSCSIMFYCSLPSSQLPPTHQLALQQIWPRFVSHKVYFILFFFHREHFASPLEGVGDGGHPFQCEGRGSASCCKHLPDAPGVGLQLQYLRIHPQHITRTLTFCQSRGAEVHACRRLVETLV